jgi:CubicO group peptidase (beta-lactamase class C family)
MISGMSETVRLQRDALAELRAWLRELGRRGVVPGGVAVVAGPDGLLWSEAFGFRALVPGREDATADTFWDCASLTKPLVTTALLLRARARGEISLDQPATSLVPELAGSAGRRSPTLGEIALHAGGLPPWEPLYALAPGGLAERAAWLGEHRGEPGRAAVYGCPGFQVLGLALERLAGRPLAEQAARELWPGRVDLAFPLPPSLARRAAPTEQGNAFERELAGRRAEGYRGWRSGVIRGETHDHAAHTLGGAAGNAGLFATASGLGFLLARWLREGDLLPAGGLAELARRRSPDVSGSEPRTWGWQLATSPDAPADPAVSPGGLAHSGFTGTSVVLDPDRRLAWALLTNRVHPRFTPHAFNAERREFHRRAARLVEGGRGDA